MKILEWCELHNELEPENNDYTGKDKIDVEIEVGPNIVYECVVEVDTYNNLPVGVAETIQMTRRVFNFNTGEEIEGLTMHLEYEEFPPFIAAAAVKKARGE